MPKAGEQAVMRVLDDFIRALNARDAKGMAAACNFPHVRLASGAMRIWHTGEDFSRDPELGGIPLEREWHSTTWDERKVLQASDAKFHVAVRFTRHTAKGEKVSTFDSLYILTRDNQHWGVQIRSSFAP